LFDVVTPLPLLPSVVEKADARGCSSEDASNTMASNNILSHVTALFSVFISCFLF
jgi:hypothetical protein